jgi:hypothetical protein
VASHGRGAAPRRSRDHPSAKPSPNGPGQNACTAASCDVAALVLLPLEGGSTERWVPANFWENDNTLCITRSSSGAHGESCKPIPSQGGESCAP